jgi:glyoxylate reductase
MECQMRVVVSRPIPEVGVEVLRAAGHEVVVSEHDRALSAGELLALTEGAEGLLSMLSDRIDEGFLAARPKVRAIANFAVGFNNINVEGCTRHGVGVSNTPDVLTNATAEIAWVLLMAAARRVGEAERDLRAERWEGAVAVFGEGCGGEDVGDYWGGADRGAGGEDGVGV